MNLYCIGYNDYEVFIYDLSLNDRFEVEAGRVLNFTGDLYRSLDNYVEGDITINEFLDDISLEYGIRPKLVMPSSNLDEELNGLSDIIKNDIMLNLISIGSAKNPVNYIPVEFCKYLVL